MIISSLFPFFFLFNNDLRTHRWIMYGKVMQIVWQYQWLRRSIQCILKHKPMPFVLPQHHQHFVHQAGFDAVLWAISNTLSDKRNNNYVKYQKYVTLWLSYPIFLLSLQHLEQRVFFYHSDQVLPYLECNIIHKHTWNNSD